MTVARRTRRARDVRRVPVLVATVVVLVGLAIVSTRHQPTNPPPAPTSVARVALDAESSAFYCGGLERTNGVVQSDVAIADLASTSRIVEVRTTNELGQISLRQVKVRPGSVTHLSPAHLVGGSLEAVSIVSSGGGIAASEAIIGQHGTAVAPCLSQAASSWWLTGGSTKKGQNLILSVFNPYASPAVFSVSFETPLGASVPPSFQGLVLPPHQLDALSVHVVAPNQSLITTHVNASLGDVVVYGIGRSTEGSDSISLLPGSPSPASEMSFPVGSSSPSLTTQLVLTNPGVGQVIASVRVHAPPGCTTHCPAPFFVTLGPNQTSTLTLSPTTRVPPGTGIATEVVASGTGLIAVQRVTSNGVVGQSAPLDNPSPSSTDRLVLVNPLASGFDDVGLLNPTANDVTVSLETVNRTGAVSIGRSFTVQPHQSLLLGPNVLRNIDDGVLLLVASGPISASADVHGALRGSSVLVAVPAT